MEKVYKLIKSRTLIQIRSHAQKFFIKLKSYKNGQLGINFTSDSVKSIKDMINQIKSINKNLNIKNLFLFLLNQCDKIKRNKKGNFNNIINRNDYKEIDKEFNKKDNIINFNSINNSLGDNNLLINNNISFNNDYSKNNNINQKNVINYFNNTSSMLNQNLLLISIILFLLIIIYYLIKIIVIIIQIM